ncbi:MAG: hypothetical protein FJ053_00815 [Cyanobacteria bacterium M_surface_10_m1_298]|nr:hypothetical protein [Cyanobacteria bacterium M_surface_10_m1_298]
MVAAPRCPLLPPPRSVDLAVIGAGVAGCTVAAALRLDGWSGSISLLEIGRGSGGRCATRRSRLDPELQVNHGAPFFNLRASTPPRLIDPLAESGSIARYTEVIRSLNGDGRIDDPIVDGFSEGALWSGNGSMDALCQGLLAIATADQAPTELHYSTLVRHLEPNGQGSALRWTLRDSTGAVIGEARWVVLSGTLLAHPRCQMVFDWDAIPLEVAAQLRGDPKLQMAQRHLAGMKAQASSNLLLTLPTATAQHWLKQPWRILQCDDSAQQRWGLRRISLQALPSGRAAVVVESSPAFARQHQDVYGSRSSAALLLGAKPPAQAEAAVLDALEQALQGALQLPTEGAERQLMRWGAAFPEAPGLPQNLMLCSESAIGFCGDAIAGDGFGRVEGALRSAETLASQLSALL